MKTSFLLTIIAAMGISTMGLASKYCEKICESEPTPCSVHSAGPATKAKKEAAPIPATKEDEAADESDFEFACHCGKEG